MDLSSYLPCEVEAVPSLLKTAAHWDAICVIDQKAPRELSTHFTACRKLDKAFDTEVTCTKATDFENRIVYAPIGELDDFDDVRVFGVAAGKAISRAIKAGAVKPVLVLPNGGDSGKFKYAALNALLGAFHELYVPIQLREDVPAKSHRIQSLGVFHENGDVVKDVLHQALMIERSRFVARDIGGGDPERMTPPNVAEYVQKCFGKSKSIKMTIIDDAAKFKKEYPLFQAVNRAASTIQRHSGRIIFLEYKPPKAARKSLLLVGKGVTYDTGGADIKAGGVMAGMSRDKCGAAAVGGFMQFVQETQPADVHVIGVMCMVRNSVGEDCYVSDEVITSRSGLRIRVGNTDAEGRMCMADALCQMKERALNMPDPHLFTIATLTGHAVLAGGLGYTFVMDNGPARDSGHGLRLKTVADQFGEPFEVSTLQREDFTAHEGVCLGEDVLQANNLPSSRTPRGHQTPAAFMIMASGLRQHGSTSAKPLKYSHIDIAGSAGENPYTPTGAPILALARTHLY